MVVGEFREKGKEGGCLIKGNLGNLRKDELIKIC